MAGTSPAELSSQLVTGLNQLVLQLILILVLAEIYTFMYFNYNEYLIWNYSFLLRSCSHSTVSKHYYSACQLLISCVFFIQREYYPCILWASPTPLNLKRKREETRKHDILSKADVQNCSVLPSVHSFTDSHTHGVGWEGGGGPQ